MRLRKPTKVANERLFESGFESEVNVRGGKTGYPDVDYFYLLLHASSFLHLLVDLSFKTWLMKKIVDAYLFHQKVVTRFQIEYGTTSFKMNCYLFLKESVARAFH